jgi:uncharacterized caspase-like protein
MANIVRVLSTCLVLAALHAGPAEARRVALVIGNAAYKLGPLANPVNDASAVADALDRQLKFDKVILKRNLSFDQFRAALAELSHEASGADLGVVYFAGHGIEVGGRNFLIPVDAALARPGALDLEAIPLDTVLGQLEGVRRLKLVILDACRNNPFALPGVKRTVSRGLARIEPEDNTLVVYAARDGTTADDGAGRRHSPFTQALLKHLATPGLEINFVFRRVRDDVVAITNRVQYPHVYGTLGGKEFYLQPHAASPAIAAAPPVEAPAAPQPALQSSEAERAWAGVKDSTSIAALEAFKARYSGSFYVDLAQVRITELRKLEDAKKVAIAPPTPAQPTPPQAGASPPPAASQTPAFGTPDVVYSVGVWRIVKTASAGDWHIFFWTDNGDTAVDLVLSSNGYWGLRRQSREYTVHSTGEVKEWRFAAQPWLKAVGRVFPIVSLTYEEKGPGLTSILIGHDQIRITLPPSRVLPHRGLGVIHLDTRSRAIKFISYDGKSHTFE